MWWTALRTFKSLRRTVPGISEKMLIQNLKAMECDGIVTRQDFKEIPPRVEYALTAFGISLSAALTPLCLWGEQHMARIGAVKQSEDERQRTVA